MDANVTSEVNCETSAGPFTIHLRRSWSPNGVDRAKELFTRQFYDRSHFFRVVPHFLVQFGISYTEDRALREFANSNIPDDPQLNPPIPFDEGILSFAGGGPNTRSSQLFIAYGHVPSLGKEFWETPIGQVVEGMENVRKLYAGYGDMPPWGKGPVQNKIHNWGAKYIETEYPLMDKFLECTVLSSDRDDDFADDDLAIKKYLEGIQLKINNGEESSGEDFTGVPDLSDVPIKAFEGKQYSDHLRQQVAAVNMHETEDWSNVYVAVIMILIALTVSYFVRKNSKIKATKSV